MSQSPAPQTPAAPRDDVRIAVEGVSKRFLLGGARGSDLRERFSLPHLLGRRNQTPIGPTREFWALRDVDFRIYSGEAVGVIGHNGSGKSTLLKLLTGILPPTSGRVRAHGRIGALIEVGAGFHPDLSGRENVYLNGSILGLSRKEIARRFDEIVSFADLEQFIDTPVKRYSSGMYMRLGFSIASHLDPEILLVDEVLAVGDAYFQNRCIRRLNEFVAQGGTVLLVSHATGQVRDFCTRCLWLDHGQLIADGPTDEVLDRYMAMVAQREAEDYRVSHPVEWEMQQAEEEARRKEEERQRQEEERQRREAEERERALELHAERLRAEAEAQRLADPSRHALTACRVLDGRGRANGPIEAGQPLRVEIDYRFAHPVPHPVFCLEIFREDGLYMFATNTYLHGLPTDRLPLTGTVALETPELALNAGKYRVQLHLFLDCTGDDFPVQVPVEHKVENAATFEVTPGRLGGYGCAYLPMRWEAVPHPVTAPPTAAATAAVPLPAEETTAA